MSDTALRAPVFFVGMPRSGTTVIFEAFAYHPELAWISDYCRSRPRQPWINGLRALVDNQFLQLRGNKKQYAGAPAAFMNIWLPRPDEAYEFWDHWTRVNFARDALRVQRATPEAAEKTRRAVAAVARWQTRSRIAAKLTGPPRMAFLRDIFPDARFVHIVRDGRAVVHSLLKVPFWRDQGGFEGPFWSDILTSDDLDKWESTDRNPAALAALQWQRVLMLARAEAASMPKETYTELRYEDYIENPHGTLSSLMKFANLAEAAPVHSHLERQPPLADMNRKHSSDFSAEDLALIDDCLQPALRDFGYL
jgi:hypothetical protein